MNLHCSQTSRQPIRPPRSLIPYEFALLSNLLLGSQRESTVWFPYEFALLSNSVKILSTVVDVWFPYEFALLSNVIRGIFILSFVWFPYEFALLSNTHNDGRTWGRFDSPKNLHYSQTEKEGGNDHTPFDSPTNLHYSQTISGTIIFWVSLIPLRICTTLKPGNSTWDWFCVWFPYEFALLSN